VGDSTIAAIDAFFDKVDSFVDKTDRVLNRGKHVDKEPASRRHSDVIDAKETARPRAAQPKALRSASTPTPKAKSQAKGTGSNGPSPYYIVESISPQGTRYVVTDGADMRAECATREHAQNLLRQLGGAA
jgi:hypothetical protein